MWRSLAILMTSTVALLVSGCMTGPLQDNPSFIAIDPSLHVSNPVWVPALGVESAYAKVFAKTLDIVDDYFEISYSNRYDGRIETFPRISPGFEQFWKPGTPDAYQRLESTLQTIRHRCAVLIQPAEDGGFFVQITVYKELEDLAQPMRSTAGAAAFRADNTVERTYEVIDPAVRDSNWIPRGRNLELEQIILQRLKKCM